MQFPNGVVVRASRLVDRPRNEGWRTFGIYLDPGWNPTWPAALVPWEDFGLPGDWASAAEQIRRAYALALQGEHVEIGCLGGLGRTGTVLACMAILAGVAPCNAVEWVRANYDSRAVETDEQASWVMWFATHLAQDG